MRNLHLIPRILCSVLLKSNSVDGSSVLCNDHNRLSPSLQNNVFMYYGLSNFYQNHRRYVKSRDDSQLNGDLSALKVGSWTFCRYWDCVRLTMIVFIEPK